MHYTLRTEFSKILHTSVKIYNYQMHDIMPISMVELIFCEYGIG